MLTMSQSQSKSSKLPASSNPTLQAQTLSFAGYGRTKMWNDYFSAYQTASAKCDHCMFGWDRKLVCSMTMLG